MYTLICTKHARTFACTNVVELEAFKIYGDKEARK